MAEPNRWSSEPLSFTIMLHLFLCEAEGELEGKLEEKEEWSHSYLLVLFACVGSQLSGTQGLGHARQVPAVELHPQLPAFCIFNFEIGSHLDAQAGLELMELPALAS